MTPTRTEKKAKIMVVIGDGNFQLLSIEAGDRGITIQELIRGVIISRPVP